MATWPANTPFVMLGHINNDITSDNVELGVGWDATHLALESSTTTSNAANVDTLPIDVSPALPAPRACVVAPSIGTQIYERIHVLPPEKSIPMIISPTELIVEVWNAYRETDQSVTAVTITGPAGVSILTSYTLPIDFKPFTSKLYTVLVDIVGAPSADNFVTWDFSGIAEPSFHVSGLRLLPFTISPDWQEGIEDEISWMTDVMAAYDDTEQRMQLRVNAQRSIQYQAAALDTREGGLLLSLLWAVQARDCGVLLWMDAAKLGTDLAGGSTLVTVDTSRMTLTDGVDTVILISDAFTWFAAQVLSHTGSAITLQAPTDKDFFANQTLVVPVKLGRMPASVAVPLPTNKTASTQIKFDLQTSQLS